MLLRWCVLGGVALLGFLYYQPVSSYVETRAALGEREAEVRQLRDEKARLERRLADSATVAALAREAGDEPRPAGRAALHRQGRAGVAARPTIELEATIGRDG